MPPHDVYIESHLGGGAVLRNKTPAKRSIGIDIDPSVISEWKRLYFGMCELVQEDVLDVLGRYKFSGNELVYADPPYLVSTRKRQSIYRFDYTIQDHERLLTQLLKLPCMVMVSGYQNDMYDDILSDWQKTSFSAKTHTGIREECVWFNYEPPKLLHDSKYLGRNFREREAIKRRQGRLRERVERMDPSERHDFVGWLISRYGEMHIKELGCK